MFRYAQINNDNICFAVSELSGEIDSPDMIRLTEDEPSPMGKQYVNGVWQVVEVE